MQVTILVIERGPEAGLVCAALARRPEVRVLDAADLGGALQRIDKQAEPVALAIAGSAALAQSADELVKRLGARGIPVIGLTSGLAPDVRQRALAAGVREIHDRPSTWQPYSELIDSLVTRFIPAGLPPLSRPTRKG
jgi:CheY-like chemotaxis protein